jgi:hypothetical protein
LLQLCGGRGSSPGKSPKVAHECRSYLTGQASSRLVEAGRTGRKLREWKGLGKHLWHVRSSSYAGCATITVEGNQMRGMEEGGGGGEDG